MFLRRGPEGSSGQGCGRDGRLQRRGTWAGLHCGSRLSGWPPASLYPSLLPAAPGSSSPAARRRHNSAASSSLQAWHCMGPACTSSTLHPSWAMGTRQHHSLMRLAGRWGRWPFNILLGFFFPSPYFCMISSSVCSLSMTQTPLPNKVCVRTLISHIDSTSLAIANINAFEEIWREEEKGIIVVDLEDIDPLQWNEMFCSLSATRPVRTGRGEVGMGVFLFYYGQCSCVQIQKKVIDLQYHHHSYPATTYIKRDCKREDIQVCWCFVL